MPLTIVPFSASFGRPRRFSPAQENSRKSSGRSSCGFFEAICSLPVARPLTWITAAALPFKRSAHWWLGRKGSNHEYGKDMPAITSLHQS